MISNPPSVKEEQTVAQWALILILAHKTVTIFAVQ